MTGELVHAGVSRGQGVLAAVALKLGAGVLSLSRFGYGLLPP